MRRLVPTVAALALALLGVAVARGELIQSGNLRLSFNGGFSPRTLPRDRLAPVTVSFSGSVAGADGGTPPPVQRISIAINRYGRLSTSGLPVCLPGELEQASTQLALSRCRGALVGHGTFLAKVAFPNLTPFPVEGSMLAFNSLANGRPAIAVHIYGQTPVEAVVVLTFRIAHRARGQFGTVLTTRIPEIAANVGYITNISFSFGRTYRYAGRPESFLSARCAAPYGFPGAFFPFAKGRFSFADGQTVPITLARDCRVRRP